MSQSSDNDLDLDLHFLPAWAKEPSNRNLYADFEGEREGRPGRGRGDRPFRRREGPGERPFARPQEGRGRPPGDQRRPEPRRRPEDRRRSGAPRQDRAGAEARQVQPEPLVEVRVTFHPDDKGVDSLARQIRMTGRAYPLFGVAQMILAKPERHSVTFAVKRGPDGQVLQPLFVCALDDTPWLSEQEAAHYALHKYFNTFYQAERTAIEPPKGTYTFVAQCGMSGVILGPPNHHDYQNQLHRLHAERFSRMPFEVFKSRVKIVRDEAVVKQWVEGQSWKTEYICLNLPEPLRLGSMEEVEKHFRETHLPVIIRQTESHTLPGTASRNLRCGPLLRLLRASWEDQKRFPMQVATVLSQQFGARGLQFFKVNKNVTHVAVARPHYLDLDLAPVSEGVRRVVTFIAEHPRCTRRQLLEALAPTPPTAAPPSPVPPEATAEPPPAAAAPATEPATQTPAAPQAPAAPPVAPPVPAPSPEATMLISDLHWLVHQGHVIEFADGLLETAKKPLPRPPKPAPAPAPATPAAAAETPSAEPSPSVPSAVPEAAGAPEASPAPLAPEPAVQEQPVAEPVPSEPAAAPPAAEETVETPPSEPTETQNPVESAAEPAAGAGGPVSPPAEAAPAADENAT